ncbi:MAG TPA: hypothetical protein VFE33_31250 [Thermoanaerobaculia bacterium]|nr:hypothetical protein [Thermoanaerobaculia bacterium]
MRRSITQGMIANFSMALCLLLLPCFAGAEERGNAGPRSELRSRQVVVLTDSGWSTPSFTADCLTGLGSDSWELTLTQTRDLQISVEDIACPGDFYEVRVDGSLIGTTFKPDAWGCSASGTLSTGAFTITLCPGTHSIEVRDAGFDGHSQAEIAQQSMCPAGFNVSGSLAPILVASPACPVLEIVKPANRDNFNLDNEDLTATTATFKARGPGVPVDWKLDLEYSTSKGYGGYTPSLPGFRTQAGASLDQTFAAEGGKITVTASAKVGTDTVVTKPVTFTVTGTAIPDASITSRLVSLYQDGATPHLLTGIAMVESTYHQFEDNTLYGREDLWPTESHADGGSHIGLMMVPTSSGLANAWSWQANTSAGVNVFRGKIALAQSRMKQMMEGKPGLRSLTALEIENMAVYLYRGASGSGSLSKQYYIPVQKSGKWDWAFNPKASSVGVAYVDLIRNNMK